MISAEQRQEICNNTLLTVAEFVVGLNKGNNSLDDNQITIRPLELNDVVVSQRRRLGPTQDEIREIYVMFYLSGGSKYHEGSLNLRPSADLITFKSDGRQWRSRGGIGTEPNLDYYRKIRVVRRDGTVYPDSLIKRQLLESLQRTWEVVSSCKITQLF